MGYLGVRGARERWCRVWRLGWERRWVPGAKVAEGERERTGDVIVWCLLPVVGVLSYGESGFGMGGRTRYGVCVWEGI